MRTKINSARRERARLAVRSLTSDPAIWPLAAAFMAFAIGVIGLWLVAT